MSIFDIIGGTNKFKKGVEIGAKPFEAKFAQYGEALKHLENNFGAQWNRTKEVADKILNSIEATERERLYGLYAQTDIKQLKSEYKEILIAALYTLSTESSNELQQSYVRSVKKYLDIKNPQTSFNFAGIENIDSQIAQKAIFQSCVEYLLLGDDGPAFFKEYGENLFSLFVIKEETKEEIWGNVLQIYSATGPLGLSEKYGFVPETPESNIGQNEAVELEDLVIDNIFHIPTNEEKTFHAKKIRLNADIHCEGKLIFEQCAIIYNGDDIKGRIRLEKNTSLLMSHCTVIGKNNKKRTENPQRCLIEGKDKTSSLVIENCLLFDCLSFVHYTETKLTRSVIRYTKLPPHDAYLFDNVYGGDSTIEDCLLESLESEKDMLTRLSTYSSKFDIISYYFPGLNKDSDDDAFMEYFKVDTKEDVEQELLKTARRLGFNNLDELENSFSLRDYSDPLLKGIKTISKCTFKNIVACLSVDNSVTQCQFANCMKIIKQEGVDCLNVSDCSFINCADILNASELNLKYSQFKNCSGEITEISSRSDQESSILHCRFLHINEGKIRISYGYRYRSKEGNKISNCLFDGVLVSENISFISAGISKDEGIILTVDDCEFRHCITENQKGRIIELESCYQGVFLNDKYATTIEIHNCRGLENVNKEGELTEDVVIQQETSMGQPIGVRLDEATVGVPGFTPDFAIIENESENNDSNFREEIIAEINDIKDLINETQKTLEENEQAASNTTAGVKDILLQAKTNSMFLHNIPSEIIEGLRNELEKARCLEKNESTPMEIKLALKEQIADLEEFIKLWEKTHQKE